MRAIIRQFGTTAWARRFATSCAVGLRLCGCGQSGPANSSRHPLPGVLENAEGLPLRQTRADRQRYAVVVRLAACPDPEAFHARIDHLLKAEPGFPLPKRCTELPDGTIISAAPPGTRPSTDYREFRIEQAQLSDGRPFWSDELTEQYLRPIEEGNGG